MRVYAHTKSCLIFSEIEQKVKNEWKTKKHQSGLEFGIRRRIRIRRDLRRTANGPDQESHADQ